MYLLSKKQGHGDRYMFQNILSVHIDGLSGQINIKCAYRTSTDHGNEGYTSIASLIKHWLVDAQCISCVKDV